MGPFLFSRQVDRAEKIKRFLDRSPNLPEMQRIMWERKMQDIAYDPKTYYERYKNIYIDGEYRQRTVIKW